MLSDVVFYNPHVDDFVGEPLQFRLLGRRALRKYGFLWDEIIKNNQVVKVAVDGSMSGIIPASLFRFFPLKLRKVLANLEFYFWLSNNGYKKHVKRIDCAVNHEDSVLVTFSYKSAVGLFGERRVIFARFKAVIFHLSHYFIMTRIKSDNIRTVPNAYVAGDSNFSQGEYFSFFFDWYDRPFLVLPFSVSSKFTCKKSHDLRKKKAIATGSFHDLTSEPKRYLYEDYIGFSGETTYHPVRKRIYESAGRYEDIIDSKVSPYRSYQTSKISRFREYFNVKQKEYFSFDIVELYNSYQFAIVGEESPGAPPVGALEAMACGCVLIANPNFFDGCGLSAGTHFLQYDGSLESAVGLVLEMRERDVSMIAETAQADITAKFSSRAVAERWSVTLGAL